MSEKQWAIKVLNAISNIIGYDFYIFLLSREDCTKNGQKSIDYAINKLLENGYSISIDRLIVFDDLGNTFIDYNKYKNIINIVPKYNYISSHYLFKYICKNNLTDKRLLNDINNLNLIENKSNYQRKINNNNNELKDIYFKQYIDRFFPETTNCCRKWVE